jgi:hypothetical protein
MNGKPVFHPLFVNPICRTVGWADGATLAMFDNTILHLTLEYFC